MRLGADAIDLIELIVDDALAASTRRPVFIGLCGAQGSGKSTIAAGLMSRLRARGISAATLSIDDLYLGHEHRAVLARDVHPLLRTRGVPGTHDVPLGLSIFAALGRGDAVRLPRFDKARDDRVSESYWPFVAAGLDVLIFEGWCVGAKAEPLEQLDHPVNRLERDEDADSSWRRFVNAALASGYQQLFARLDRLVLLAAPGFDIVHGWRLDQERRLRETSSGPGIMNDDEVGRFVEHYERLTQHILREMPSRADLTIRLAADRSPPPG